LDPNSIDVALALTELHLKSGQSDRALRVVAQFISRKLSDKIKHILVSGREERKNGKLDAAEELLLEATTLDPNSSKALFELGKIYQEQEQMDKAMTVYRRALSLIFGDQSGPADSTN
jgi:Flp pilus assembly protein TadD